MCWSVALSRLYVGDALQAHHGQAQSHEHEPGHARRGLQWQRQRVAWLGCEVPAQSLARPREARQWAHVAWDV